VIPNSTFDVNDCVQESGDMQPRIVAVGARKDLVFNELFVFMCGKAIRCTTILEAIDLAFKSFYVFHVEFPSSCYGAWQFLDYCVYKMKVTSTVISTVKEITAFVSSD
jgi:hypothetical protein